MEGLNVIIGGAGTWQMLNKLVGIINITILLLLSLLLDFQVQKGISEVTWHNLCVRRVNLAPSSTIAISQVWPLSTWKRGLSQRRCAISIKYKLEFEDLVRKKECKLFH